MSFIYAALIVGAVAYVGALVGYRRGLWRAGHDLAIACKDHPEDLAALERIVARAQAAVLAEKR